MTNKQNKKYGYTEQGESDYNHDYEEYVQQKQQQKDRRRNKQSHKRDDYYADENWSK